MATSAKALALAGELRAALIPRFTTVSDIAFDSDGSPYLTLTNGSLVAGQQAGLVKVSPLASIGLNSLGLSQESFGPHVMQVVLETSTIASVALMTEVNKVALFGEVEKFGTKVQLYMSANANAIGVEDITSSNLKATWDGGSLKWRQKSSI